MFDVFWKRPLGRQAPELRGHWQMTSVRTELFHARHCENSADVYTESKDALVLTKRHGKVHFTMHETVKPSACHRLQRGWAAGSREASTSACL